MYSGICSSGADHLDLLAQNGAQCLGKGLLNRRRIGLNLPTMIVGALESHPDKVSVAVFHFAFCDKAKKYLAQSIGSWKKNGGKA